MIFYSTNVPEFDIYDIGYSNTDEIVIVEVQNKKNIKSITYNNSQFILHKQSRQNVWVLKQSTYEPQISIQITDATNKVHTINVKVNMYPQIKDTEIILSTIIKNEDKYIKQWIEYHEVLGVDKFIIYENSSLHGHALPTILDKYIKSGKVILIEWNYPLHLFNWNERSSQTTQQNHTLFMYRNGKYIGYTDIDEYLIPKNDDSIHDQLDRICKENSIDYNNLTSIELWSRIFMSLKIQPEENYEFFKIDTCYEDFISWNRQKVFVNPRNVSDIIIHTASRKSKENIIFTDTLRYMYFNHYFFLNKAIGSKRRGVLGWLFHLCKDGKKERKIISDLSILKFADKIIKT